MLLDQANPYRPRLPQVLHLDAEDFDSPFSAANDEAIGQEREWSVVVYMAANCNLAPFMFDNLLELKSVASNAAMHVCVLFAGPLITDTFFARLNPEGKLSDDVLLRFSSINSSDPRTLTLALQLANIFPAKRRIAFLCGHGKGWKGVLLNENLAKPYVDFPDRLDAPASGLACQARIFKSLQRSQNHINSRLGTAGITPHGRMDILAFDACYMGNLEVVTTLAAEARIFVVTEGRAPGAGFPYAKILAELQSNPHQTSEDLARYVLQANDEKYQDSRLPLRQIALLSDGLSVLAEALAKLTRQLGLEQNEILSSVRYAMENAASLGATGNIDLKDFVAELLNQPIPAEARQAAIAFQQQFSRLDLSSDPSVPGSGNGNLSIYGPAPTDFDPAYLQQSPSLAPLRVWTSFLAEYYLKILGESSSHPLVQAINATMKDLIGRGIYPPPTKS